MSEHDGLVTRTSPDSVTATVQRIVAAAQAHGVTVFATVDHAAGARSVGLDMPETQVVFVGNPAAGTPAMLEAPDLALDLPTRILVRAAAGAAGSTVVFHDPGDIARAHSLSASLADGLRGVVALVDHALEETGSR